MCRRSREQRFREVGIARLTAVHIEGRVIVLSWRSHVIDPVLGTPRLRGPVSRSKSSYLNCRKQVTA
jgi:hypothetical protein